MKRKSVRKKTIVRKKSTHSRLLFYVLSFLILLSAGFLINTSLAKTQQRVLGAASPDEIIVKYRETTPETEKENVRKAHKTSVRHKIKNIRAEVLVIHEGTVDENIKQLNKNPHVEYAEPNYKAEAFGITNDTSLSQQWGLFKINAANQTATSAWDVTTGDAIIKVAVLDTGIEESHPDLLGKVIGNTNFTTSPTAYDQNGHGTHVAGITAAATNNQSGVAGTGYNTALLNGKVLGDDGSGYYSWIANGIVWAADQGAQVINLSLGGSSSSLALQDAINYAWSKGVVIVAAAGNSNSSSPNYPAYYTNAIAVAATDSNDKKASFSNYGSWVDVAAPGTSIYSTYKGNSYATLSGTSMASPFTAGAAALIWAKGICTTNNCVREHLEQTADQIAGTGSLWSRGRINAYSAVTGVTSAPTATPLPTVTTAPTPTSASSQVMTVPAIDMWYTTLAGGNRRIYTTVTVVDDVTKKPLASATVNATIAAPSGTIYTFSGRTNTRGKYSFNVRSSEKGTYTTTVTNVQRTSYIYIPTLTSKTLIVQ